MQIEKLLLQNFHGFDSREIEFTERFTVLIGENATGKTAILDGLAVSLGAFLLGFGLKPTQTRPIKTDEIYRKTYWLGEIPDPADQFPVKVTCKGNIDDQKIEWTRCINKERGTTTYKEAKNFISIAEKLNQAVVEGKVVDLPVISYYGTGRLWVQKKQSQEEKKIMEQFKPGSRLLGYRNCLDPASDPKASNEWFLKMTLVEIQNKKEMFILNGFRRAISSCLQSWATKIEYDILTNEIRATLHNGQVLPFKLLSDGMRNMLGMVADLAYRIATLNPHLGENAITETQGVVLIDEIDLHLHPKWQRKIVEDLKTTFPKVQFIVTTHSPFIIQSLLPGELRLLQVNDDDEEVNAELYFEKSIEDIVENVMDVSFPSRSDRLQNMYDVAKEYHSLLKNVEYLNNSEKEVLKEKLDELVAPFSNNVAYYAFLEMKRASAGLEVNENETD